MEAFSLISEDDRRRLPEGIEDAYPLTKLQAGMVFHSSSSASSTLYHNVHTLHVETPYDNALLHETLGRISARHPALRTSFDLGSYSEMLQLVHERAAIPIEVEDIGKLNPREQECAIDSWFEAEQRRLLRIDCPPLLRFHVHKRGPECFQLSWSCHHAIMDVWSEAIVIVELFQFYLATLERRPDPLPSLPVFTFRDYETLERETIESDECLHFWTRNVTEGLYSELPPWLSDESLSKSPLVAKHKMVVASQRFADLKRFADAAAVPLKSVLLAAYLRTLRTFSGQQIVRTGLIVSTRPEVKGIYRVCGLFLNTVPIELDLGGGDWLSVARRTFEREREILPYNRFPVAELQRILGGRPLFDTVFSFNQFHFYRELPNSEKFRCLDYRYVAETHFPLLLDLSVNPRSSELEVNFCYDASRLCVEHISELAAYYGRVLYRMVSHPKEHHESDSMVLLSDQDRRLVLSQWRHKAYASEYSRTVPLLFEAQVKRTPDAVAVAFESQRLTYQELNARANRMARFLLKQGVGPEILVGICMDRSIELVVALVAILKAGGAYVPLDPSFPSARLTIMIADTQLPLLLTHQRLLQAVPDVDARVFYLDRTGLISRRKVMRTSPAA
ncbi:MAG: condensation domain-containing protein [Isosphaeraceae bacterium]